MGKKTAQDDRVERVVRRDNSFTEVVRVKGQVTRILRVAGDTVMLTLNQAEKFADCFYDPADLEEAVDTLAEPVQPEPALPANFTAVEGRKAQVLLDAVLGREEISPADWNRLDDGAKRAKLTDMGYRLQMIDPPPSTAKPSIDPAGDGDDTDGDEGSPEPSSDSGEPGGDDDKK